METTQKGLAPPESSTEGISNTTDAILAYEMHAMTSLTQAVAWAYTFVNAYSLLESAAKQIRQSTQDIQVKRGEAIKAIEKEKGTAIVAIDKRRDLAVEAVGKKMSEALAKIAAATPTQPSGADSSSIKRDPNKPCC